MPRVFGGQGVAPTLKGLPTNVYSLPAGGSQLIPAGTWNIQCGPVTIVQEYDQVTGTWRPIGGESFNGNRAVTSDGVNFRVANLSGCVTAVLVTNGGSGYTSVPTVTASAGAGVFKAIVGGAVSTTVTVTNGGTGYDYAPQVVFSAPPEGNGVQATGVATITGGVVTSVTVTNQGAGYTDVPTITFIPDSRDDSGTGASATAVLTGSGTVTAVLVLDHGTAVSAVPTLSFSGGGGSSAAATALMCFTTTAYTVTSAGSGYVGNVYVIGDGGTPTTAAAYTNPTIQTGAVRVRPARYLAQLASTGVTTTGQSLYDGGIFMGVPTGFVAGYTGTVATSAAQVSFTVGGVSDTYVMLPF